MDGYVKVQRPTVFLFVGDRPCWNSSQLFRALPTNLVWPVLLHTSVLLTLHVYFVCISVIRSVRMRPSVGDPESNARPAVRSLASE